MIDIHISNRYFLLVLGCLDLVKSSNEPFKEFSDSSLSKMKVFRISMNLKTLHPIPNSINCRDWNWMNRPKYMVWCPNHAVSVRFRGFFDQTGGYAILYSRTMPIHCRSGSGMVQRTLVSPLASFFWIMV